MKKIICLETREVFESLSQLCDILGTLITKDLESTGSSLRPCERVVDAAIEHGIGFQGVHFAYVQEGRNDE